MKTPSPPVDSRRLEDLVKRFVPFVTLCQYTHNQCTRKPWVSHPPIGFTRILFDILEFHNNNFFQLRINEYDIRKWKHTMKNKQNKVNPLHDIKLNGTRAQKNYWKPSIQLDLFDITHIKFQTLMWHWARIPPLYPMGIVFPIHRCGYFLDIL